MKKYLFMAVAAIAALSSCSNEDEIVATENGKGETTFFATMENDATTRVTLNVKTPSWEPGDVISIDGHNYTAAADVATSSAFTGTGATESTHHAYYPASMYSAGTITLPASYTYTAGKFNMPMYAESTTNALQFKNLCGVLAITVSSSQMSSVTSIVVSSDKQMNGAISSITDAGVLTFASATLTDAEKKVTLTATSPVTISTNETFYVPVPAGTHNPLVISVSDGTTTKMMITKRTGGVEVARNKIYPVTFAENFPEYVEIGGKKWATMNLGATTVAGSFATCAGDYYQYGSVNTLYESISWNDLLASISWKNGKESGYVMENLEYTTNADLPAANDVVQQKLGNGWRIPTKADFEALHNACTSSSTTTTLDSSNPGAGVYWLSADQTYLTEYTGVDGILYVATADPSKRVFFPAANYNNNDFVSAMFGGGCGAYWSSSFYASDNARYLHFEEGNVSLNYGMERCYGLTVRPVKD